MSLSDHGWLSPVRHSRLVLRGPLMAEPYVVVESVDAPARIRALDGGRAQMLTTCGDTACAIHALCGEDQAGEIRMSQHPRAFLRQSFGESASVFVDRVGDAGVVAQLVDVLWEELLKPCTIPTRGARGEPRPESLAAALSAGVDFLSRVRASVLRSFQTKADARRRLFRSDMPPP